MSCRRCTSIGLEYDGHDDSESKWFGLMDDVVPLMREAARVVVMPSCRIKALSWWYGSYPPDWIIAWHKGSPGHAAAIGFNDWEPHLVWGKPAQMMHDHFQTRCGFDANGHPCPKPIEWAQWLVSRVSGPDDIVCDPFMGSGTVLRAAKDLGRKCIGVDQSERYCEIAAKRLAQEVMDFGGAA